MSNKINYADLKGYKQIRSYKLFEPPIGKGAVGVVYKAWDSKRNQLAAIKSISSKLLSDEQRMRCFQNEVKALHYLKHDNIIKIYSVEKTINNIYIALEFANGGTLNELLRYYKNKYNSGIPEPLVQRIIQQLLSGLEYMHEKKHMHRDLKLDNILLHFNDNYEKDNFVEYEKSGFDGMQIKIADLGYAKNIEGTDLASTLCGTPITMPPEVVQNHLERNFERGYNAKADLWSLGALTYEMLVSQPPFNGYNIDDLFKNISKGVYNYPQNCMISIEAISFINGLLTFSNYDRFSFEDMKSHPFIVKDPSTFHPIDLNIIPKDNMSGNKIEVDSKNCNNFLWVMFKNNGLKKLDQLNVKDLNDEKIMESVCIINQNMLSDKRDMLSLFRKGAKKQKDKFNKLNISEEVVKDVEIEKPNEQIKNEINCNVDHLYNNNNLYANPVEEANKQEKVDVIEDNSNKIDCNEIKDNIQEPNIENKVILVEVEAKEDDRLNQRFSISNNNEQEKPNLEKSIVKNENLNEVENNQMSKLINDLQPKNVIENDLVCINQVKSEEKIMSDRQMQSVWKDSSYIQCDGKAKIEEDEVWEILSSYSLLDKDGDWPVGFEVQVQTYSEYQVVQEHFLSKAN